MKIINRNYLHIFIGAIFIGSYLYLLSFYFSNRSPNIAIAPSNQEIKTSKSTEKVAHVTDGDTFEIECVLQGLALQVKYSRFYG